MGIARGKRPVGIDLRPDRVSQQMIIGKQASQSHASKGGSRSAQEVAPVEERGSGGGQVFRVHGCVSVMEDSENKDSQARPSKVVDDGEGFSSIVGSQARPSKYGFRTPWIREGRACESARWRTGL